MVLERFCAMKPLIFLTASAASAVSSASPGLICMIANAYTVLEMLRAVKSCSLSPVDCSVNEHILHEMHDHTGIPQQARSCRARYRIASDIQDSEDAAGESRKGTLERVS